MCIFFCAMFCISLFILSFWSLCFLSYFYDFWLPRFSSFYWTLYCLSFFDLCLLITHWFLRVWKMYLCSSEFRNLSFWTEKLLQNINFYILIFKFSSPHAIKLQKTFAWYTWPFNIDKHLHVVKPWNVITFICNCHSCQLMHLV